MILILILIFCSYYPFWLFDIWILVSNLCLPAAFLLLLVDHPLPNWGAYNCRREGHGFESGPKLCCNVVEKFTYYCYFRLIIAREISWSWGRVKVVNSSIIVNIQSTQSKNFFFNMFLAEREGTLDMRLCWVYYKFYVLSFVALHNFKYLLKHWLVGQKYQCLGFKRIISICRGCNFVDRHWCFYINLFSIVLSRKVPGSTSLFFKFCNISASILVIWFWKRSFSIKIVGPSKRPHITVSSSRLFRHIVSVLLIANFPGGFL